MNASVTYLAGRHKLTTPLVDQIEKKYKSITNINKI